MTVHIFKLEIEFQGLKSIDDAGFAISKGAHLGLQILEVSVDSSQARRLLLSQMILTGPWIWGMP
jgi:hypothetical protein